jgi:rubrerythrin
MTATEEQVEEADVGGEACCRSCVQWYVIIGHPIDGETWPCPICGELIAWPRDKFIARTLMPVFDA